MRLLALLEFLRKHRKTVVRLCWLMLVLLVVVDALPALVDKEHAHTEAEHVPGFWAAFGFIGCAVLILISKGFGHLGIMTREDYYDR